MDSDEHPASISEVMDRNSATTKIGPGTPPTARILDLVGMGEKRNPVFISAVRREFLEMFRGVRKSPNSDGFFHANHLPESRNPFQSLGLHQPAQSPDGLWAGGMAFGHHPQMFSVRTATFLRRTRECRRVPDDG
jgi:hypothetical protein